ncbi:MAG: 2Fe-2S iron-sulfur cluster-binding protein [Treponema sp.]|nr:2Fe-2S iron-sulfur cluster-binding protein [Treponema sp.]
MTIGFILNGEDVDIRLGEGIPANARDEHEHEQQSHPAARLVDILRNTFSLFGTKAGCYCGNCGACSVIFNGDVAKACLIPAFKIKDSEIITIEGFAQTDEYQDIIRAFAEAGVQSCGFCDTGKILATEVLLSRNHRLSREEILAGFSGIRCRCTDPETLWQMVMAAFEYRRQRIYGRSF